MIKYKITIRKEICKIMNILKLLDGTSFIDTNATEFSSPTIAAGQKWYETVYKKEYITDITFVNSFHISNKPGIVQEIWDASEKRDNSIVVQRFQNKLYICNTKETGKIYANEDSREMFYFFENLRAINNLKMLDTSRVLTMEKMFCGCKSLKAINTLHFNTSNVVDMGLMFGYCERLQSLDLRNFDTRKVLNMQSIFRNSPKLEKIYVGGKWTTYNANVVNMFYGCGTRTLEKIIV